LCCSIVFGLGFLEVYFFIDVLHWVNVLFLCVVETAIQARLQMVMEVRDSLEIAHTAEYLNFLKCYFRAFSAILLQITKPQFVDNPEHKLRNIVVEILNRLPHSEVLRPFVQDLLKVAMQVLTTDNEENGLICIRIIFDLLRNFRPTLENEVQPFLDFVCKIYQNFKLTVSHFFENMAMTGEDVKPMDTLSDQSINPATATGSQLNPSTRSFKIVTESPLVVMFLFQLYSHFVQANIPQLLPLMVAAISVPGPERVPPYLRTHFTELKGAQVKVGSYGGNVNMKNLYDKIKKISFFSYECVMEKPVTQ
jgi:transformation/transcription domain-associated protein